jgi:hypothetical protein
MLMDLNLYRLSAMPQVLAATATSFLFLFFISRDKILTSFAPVLGSVSMPVML